VREQIRALDRGGHLAMRVGSWGIVCAVVALCGVRIARVDALGARALLTRFPVKAVEYVSASGLRGALLNTYEWGGYLIWRFQGARPVFIDGRADVYGESIWREYLQVIRAGPGWRTVLDRHDVQYLILDRRQPVCRVLDIAPEFVRVYRDAKAVVYVRVGGLNAGLGRLSGGSGVYRGAAGPHNTRGPIFAPRPDDKPVARRRREFVPQHLQEADDRVANLSTTASYASSSASPDT